jgi:hypothetical protein
MYIVLTILLLWIIYSSSNNEPSFKERIVDMKRVGKTYLYKIERVYKCGKILIYYKKI